MRGLIPFLILLTSALPLRADEAPAVPTADTAGTPKPTKIDDFQKSHPEDPRPAPAQPPATDAAGHAGGAKPLPGDLKEMKSADEREAYVASVKEALVKWDKRIVDLHEQQEYRSTYKLLKTLRARVDKDLTELQASKGHNWLDVKARIEARFRRMEKELSATKH